MKIKTMAKIIMDEEEKKLVINTKKLLDECCGSVQCDECPLQHEVGDGRFLCTRQGLVWLLNAIGEEE